MKCTSSAIRASGSRPVCYEVLSDIQTMGEQLPPRLDLNYFAEKFNQLFAAS
jgi:hypothetical protein